MAKTDLKPEEVERLAREALVAVSFDTMMVNRTGSWRYMRPVYRDKIPPCNEGCPAGENIERYMVYAAQGRFREAWETIRQENPLPGVCGRVCYHPCENVCNRKFHDEGLAINDMERAIFDYGLSYHASYINNKSAPIPDGMRGEVERLLRKLGYRLVLRGLEHDAEAKAGDSLRVSMEWENVGVAPPYRDYRLAFRLTGPEGRETRLATETSVKGWLPGSREVEETLALPADLAAGEYGLALAVVDAKTGEPAVRLAIEGRQDDGWYRLSSVTVAGSPAG